jgi:signal transduction histidine kinase
MSLRLRLIAAMTVVVALTFVALALLVRVNGDAIPGEPMLRYVRLNRTALRHISVPAQGRPSLVGVDRIPQWLGLALFDVDGSLVETNMGIDASSLPSAVAGRRSYDDFAALLRERYPNRRYVIEPIMFGGTTRGSYLALFRDRATVSVGGVDRPAWLISALSVAFVLILLFSGVATVVVGRFGSAVARLERAADAISLGDLETSVVPSGTTEIASLARALDRMRESLREERDRRVRFIAAVSHDLRTPLTAIAGYLEALEDGVSVDPAENRKFLAVMREKARVLDGRISDLLDFAKASTGEWRMRLEDVSLKSFLNGLALDYAADAESIGIFFSADVRLTGDPVASLDGSLASRAIENVVANAFRYTPSGGHVRFSARETDDGVELTVSDDGPGIAPADLPRVFDPYYRGSSSRREAGSGLGLFITRSIAVNHGWTVSIESEPGRGTSVRLSIPFGKGDYHEVS